MALINCAREREELKNEISIDSDTGIWIEGGRERGEEERERSRFFNFLFLLTLRNFFFQ